MLRRKLIRSGAGLVDDFRWRSVESTRLEGLTDAVFGFALTLLVVSLEVPRTFDELLASVRDFPAFAITFGILIIIWYEHYKFFRRYGLENRNIIVLNAILLFQIVFYMYPLKFLFTLSLRGLTGGDLLVSGPGGALIPMIEEGQQQTLVYLFSAGWISVWFTYALMFWQALQARERLELNELEVLNTRFSVFENLIGVGVGILAILLTRAASPSQSITLAGLCYLMMIPITWAIQRASQKQKQALRRRLSVEDLGASEPG